MAVKTIYMCNDNYYCEHYKLLYGNTMPPMIKTTPDDFKRRLPTFVSICSRCYDNEKLNTCIICNTYSTKHENRLFDHHLYDNYCVRCLFRPTYYECNLCDTKTNYPNRTTSCNKCTYKLILELHLSTLVYPLDIIDLLSNIIKEQQKQYSLMFQ